MVGKMTEEYLRKVYLGCKDITIATNLNKVLYGNNYVLAFYMDLVFNSVLLDNILLYRKESPVEEKYKPVHYLNGIIFITRCDKNENNKIQYTLRARTETFQGYNNDTTENNILKKVFRFKESGKEIIPEFSNKHLVDKTSKYYIEKLETILDNKIDECIIIEPILITSSDYFRRFNNG